MQELCEPAAAPPASTGQARIRLCKPPALPPGAPPPQVLVEGLEGLGVFDIVSSKEGLPLVAFHLKDDPTGKRWAGSHRVISYGRLSSALWDTRAILWHGVANVGADPTVEPAGIVEDVRLGCAGLHAGEGQ